MRRLMLVMLLFGVAWSAMGQSDPLQDALKDFKANVVKNRFAVRGFSADPEVIFRWTGTGIALPTPKLQTLGVLAVSSVSLRDGRVKIEGTRYTVIRGEDGGLRLTGASDAVLTVELEGANPAQVLPLLKTEIFFPTMGAAIAALPSKYAKELPYKEPSSKSPGRQPLQSPCAFEGATYKNPTINKTFDPEFPQAALQQRVRGRTWIVFTVDETGHTSDFWIGMPAGYGMDEAAARAIAKDTFVPATCDGVSIKTQISMSVAFEMR